MASNILEDYILQWIPPNIMNEDNPHIDIDFNTLYDYDDVLAMSFIINPTYNLKSLNDSLKLKIPDYDGRIGLTNLPETTSLRKVSYHLLGNLLQVKGIVTRATPAEQVITKAVFECPSCHSETHLYLLGTWMQYPPPCDCGEKRRENNDLKSEYKQRQVINMQESPDEISSNQTPRILKVELEEELSNKVNPGDRVTVVGVLRARQKERKDDKPEMEIYLQGVSVTRLNAEDENDYTEAEIADFYAKVEDKEFFSKLAEKIAPTIHGNLGVKKALLLQQVGGVKKIIGGDLKRGDIHILLAGDASCLTGETRITLGDGTSKRIMDLGETHLQKINQSVRLGIGNGKRSVATVFHKYENQPIIRVETETGRVIRGSYNHPLLVFKSNGWRKMSREWVRLDELKVGDRLCVSNSIGCHKESLVPTNYKYVIRSKFGPKRKATLPEFVTPELGAILGRVVTDGWVDKYMVGTSVNDEEQDVIPRLAKYFGDAFKIVVHVRPVKPKRNRTEVMTVIELYDMDVASNLIELQTKRIPEVIFQSNNEVVSNFLSWVFDSDGSCFLTKNNKPTICLTSANTDFLRGIQLLLTRFGVHSRINTHNLLIRRSQDILRFSETVGFQSNKKKTRLENVVIRCKDIYIHRRKTMTEKIKSITFESSETVYDVEVPEYYQFIANGIISHNTGKSTLLRSAIMINQRGIFTTGTGSSRAGLTASVSKDKDEGWVLDAGAMVLADTGMVAIDELDKMRDEDRGAMHTAMESGVIAINKAGINTVLNARTSVLATCNPKLGRWNTSETLLRNLNNFPETLLSRFDLIFIFVDEVDKQKDVERAEYVDRIMRSTEGQMSDIKWVKRFLGYAKKLKPKVTEEVGNRIIKFFVDLRQVGKETNTVAVTQRQQEALYRLSEASAKLHLREETTNEDAENALEAMKASLAQVGIDPETGQADIDALYSGIPKTLGDKLRLLPAVLRQLEKELNKDLDTQEFSKALSDLWKIPYNDAEKIVNMALLNNVFFRPHSGCLKVV